MLKVVLVDDEIPVLNHLQTAIPWKELSMDVVCTANCGSDALTFCKNNKADILITDIRMPEMDGLTLCKEIRNSQPETQIIILSGYSDFAYAKQAIDLQVAGYSLKPIDVTDLTDTLRKAANKILKANKSNGDYLLDAIEENDVESIKSILAELSLNTDRLYLAASMNVHNIGDKLGADFTHKLGKHNYLYISNTPFSYLEAEKIIAFTKDMGGIGIYREAVKTEDLRLILDEVMSMAFQFFVNGTPTLCTDTPNPLLTEEMFGKLKEAGKAPDSLKDFLTELSAANCSLLFDMKSAFRFYNKLASCKYIQAPYSPDEIIIYGYTQLLVNFKTFSEMLIKTAETIQFSSIPEIKANEGSGNSFLSILKYIEKNYQEDISLKIISEEFHLNANYISQLIKSETGLTYTQYLTELRIGKAKDLMKSNSMSLAEISEAVGFNDYFYFIKKFKKAVGVTPGKYRE